MKEFSWGSLLFHFERKMGDEEQKQFYILPKLAFRLDRSAGLALCFHQGGSWARRGGLVPCLYHHIPDKSELLPGEKYVPDTSATKSNGWDSTNTVYELGEQHLQENKFVLTKPKQQYFKGVLLDKGGLKAILSHSTAPRIFLFSFQNVFT